MKRAEESGPPFTLSFTSNSSREATLMSGTDRLLMPAHL